MADSKLKFCGIITLDYRVVEVKASKAALRAPEADEAVFSCSVTEGSVSIVFSTTTGSEFVISPNHGKAVRAYVEKVREAQQFPGFNIGSLLDVRV